MVKNYLRWLLFECLFVIVESMIKKNLSDGEILNAISTGNDDNALEFLYARILPKVKVICRKYSFSADEAYDIFQDAILKFYDYVKKGNFKTSYSVEGFILTISKNKAIDLYRKNSRRGIIKLPDYEESQYDLPPQQDPLITQEKSIAISKLFEAIGDKCKELLLMSVFDRVPMKEIAVTLGFSSENSAKTQNYKCKQKLAKQLETNPELAKEVLNHVE